jgi:hypothetical protein
MPGEAGERLVVAPESPANLTRWTLNHSKLTPKQARRPVIGVAPRLAVVMASSWHGPAARKYDTA